MNPSPLLVTEPEPALPARLPSHDRSRRPAGARIDPDLAVGGPFARSARPGWRPGPAFTLAVALALTVVACGGDDPCDRLADGQIARAADHGGAGLEVAVALSFQDGVPVEADLGRCLAVSGPAVGATAVARRPREIAFTLLLVDPGASAAENARARAAVRAVLAQRPADERVAIYRWGAETTQVAPFLADRPVLAERLTEGLAPAGGSIAPPAEALAVAGAALAGLSAPGTVAQRTLVIVTARAHPALPATGAGDGTLVVWLGPEAAQASAAALSTGLRFSFAAADVNAATADASAVTPDLDAAVAGSSGEASSLSAAVAELSARIDAYQRYGHYAVAACGVPPGGALAVRAGRAPPRPVRPLIAEDAAGGSCDAPRLAQAGPPQPRRIELVFTPEQKAAAAALHQQRSREDFPVAVRMSPDSQPVQATAHYRGEGSYACPRRNYSVNLAGRTPRFVFPGFAQDKFHLVSMCRDRFYLRNLLVLTTLAAEGLFPVPFDLIELVVDGQEQGMYLLLENAADSLRVQQAGVRAVLRRYKVPAVAATTPEVRWVAAPAPESEALASYHGILAGVSGLQGAALEAGLRRRFHLDGYLLWTAILNGFQSGDYVDEVFFYATESTDAAGARSDYHLVMGWDQDDAFSTCHFGGALAIQDPAGLLGCSESELDRRIFSDPLLYRRYAEVLGRWLDRFTVERFAGRLRETADRLLVHLRKPAVLAAMTELGLDANAADGFALVTTLMAGELELLVTQYDERRASLRARLEKLGSGLPGDPSAGVAIPDPGPGDLQPARTEPAPAAIDPARVVPAASGARLAALWLEGAEPAAAGGRVFAGFHDRQLGVRCWFARAADGSQRCLPLRSFAAAVLYQDAACTRPVQVRPASACEPPAYLGVRSGQGCPGAEVLYRAGAPVAEAELFGRDAAGGCARLPAPSATDQVLALEEAPPAAFVAAVPAPAPAVGGRLVPARLIAEDGAASPAGWRDTQLGHGCALLTAADGELRCLPAELPVVQAGLFADDRCRVPAAVGLASTCARAEQVLRAMTARCETRFAVAAGGDRAVAHQQMGGRCGPVAGDPPATFPLGMEVPAATFAGGLTTGALGSAGRLRPLVRLAGDAAAPEDAFHDGERQVTCLPGVAADGLLRCLPRSEGEIAMFSDPDCRAPVVSGRLTCAPPTVLALAMPGTCPARSRLHRVGAPYFGGVYERQASRCLARAFPSQALFHLGPEIPPTTFAALKFTPP